MQIKKLVIENFRNHELSTIDMDAAFLVFRGSNFAGKSSIAQGISMLLTPTTTSLDATGRGFVTKIKRGSPKAVLTGVIQGSKHTIERTVTLNTNTSGRTDSSKCLSDPDFHPSPFERLLDSNKAALAVCLNTDKFFTWDEKDQKSLLAKLALPKKYDFEETLMDAVDKALGEGTIDFDGEPFAIIEKAYKLLYKERESVNRQVKDFSIPDALPTSGMNVTTLQNELTEARARQKKLSAERDVAISKNNEESLRHSKLAAKVDALRDKINEERMRIEAIEKRILSDVRLKDLTKIAEGKTSFDALEAERSVLIGKIARNKTKIEAYGKVAGASGETCPTCQQTIDGDTIAELHAHAVQKVAAGQARDNEILQLMKSLGDVTGAVKLVTDHKSALKEKGEIQTIIAEKEKLADAAQAESNKIPTHTDVLIPFVKPLDEVDAEITAILAKLQPAMAAAERAKEIETKTLQLGRLKEKAVSVDLLVKTFDKDGIKAELLAEHIGAFEDKLNFVMGDFGYECTLSIEPFEFIVKDTKGVETPVKELSGSEQLMFAVALQSAVSRAAGIGIVIADKMDTFLPAQRSKANKCLYGLVKAGMLEQVIVIVSDDSLEVPKLPDSAFFFVEGGTVRRL